MKSFAFALPLVFAAVAAVSPVRAVEFLAGAAREDVSPATPVRLSGYASRQTEATGVAQRLWAKALAISEADGPSAVLVTVDNCGVCAPIVEEVARRLEEKVGLPRERFTVASSHTHSAPHARGFAPNIFVGDLPADQQGRLDDYSDFLTDRIEAAALGALAAREPALLSWNEGHVTFARNRRTPGGPVDHALPVLSVRGVDGRVLAVVANYACHCTTLEGGFNESHGDWAGCAQEELEKRFPGGIALVTIGCGADANPHPRGTRALAEQHGAALAAEAENIARHAGRPLDAALVCKLGRADLPFVPPMERAGWERQAEEPGVTGFLAKRKLAVLDAGGALPASLPYVMQTWSFGDQLTLVFLVGEVVVDYSYRLREMFDPERLWITAYANDVPCYIPSKRILEEGGYEAESSLWYYDRASRLAPETEDIILKATARLIPESLRRAGADAMPEPRSARDSLAAMRVGGGLEIELVASEPLVTDPIAVDWDARGRIWVLEMGDYPLGTDGKLKAGGRVKRLEDTDGDGLPDMAVTFLEDIAFPTGILCWQDGVFVCSAPDILFVRDTDGDGRADDIQTRYTGWPTHNFNARVNSLGLGLDGWIYGSGGLFGGTLEPGGVDTSGRDFRFHPASGLLEAASGQTQQGRARDDWDNWFGCDNTNLLWHYPFPESAACRNDRVAAPSPNVPVPAEPDPNRLHPISRLMERYNDPHLANRTTSATGLGIYRDNWLGDAYYGNAFTGEAVHNLVRRYVLEPAGATIAGHRAPDEQEREFLASRDNWSRFVQARTGPDGALWLVDMYRFVIEHPTWIPEETQKRLDLRAGSDKGRIYRVKARGKPLREVPDLTVMSTPELAAHLETPNGTERDRVHAELLGRRDRADGARRLAELAVGSGWPATRAQALALLHAIDPAQPDFAAALKDPDPRVRRVALRMARPRGSEAAALADDPDPGVRYELALSAPDPESLRLLIAREGPDVWMRAAILSAVGDAAGALLPAAMALPESAGKLELVHGLMASVRDPRSLLPSFLPRDGRTPGPHEMRILADLLKSGSLEAADLAIVLPSVMAKADEGSPDALRLAARAGAASDWLVARVPGPLEAVVLEELAAAGDPTVPALFLARWKSMGPATHASILRMLLTRAEWVAEVLDAVESGVVLADAIPLAERQRLAAEDPRAARLVGVAGAGAAPPEERMRRLAGAAGLSGDAARGGVVFAQLCATCHALRGSGFPVGPDISAYGGKPAADFVAAIVAPSQAIEPRFVACAVSTSDGRTRTGIVRDETAASLVVAQPGGLNETLLRTEVTEIAPLRFSLMPEGLDAALTTQSVADLLAFIRRSAPAPFGLTAAAESESARQAFLRDGNSLMQVTQAAGVLPYPGWAGTRPLHFCRQTAGQNRLEWEAKPDGPAGADGRVRFRFAAAMGFHSQPSGKFALRVNGGDPVEFDISLADGAWRSGDGRLSLDYAVSEANAEDSCGVAVIAVPAATLPEGRPVVFSVAGSDSGSARWFGIYEME